MISIIIVYTDASKLEEAIKWIQKQTYFQNTQIISLDNRNKRFSSAAKALNYGADVADGDVLVFMHQDIYLWDLYSIEKIYNYLSNNPNSIVGVAGRNAKEGVYTDIFETELKKRNGIRARGKIRNVTALDECLFAMTKNRWDELRFDEICCDNWHCYAMDICFNNLLSGGSNVLLPLEICHLSKGNPRNEGFRLTIKNLVYKYRKTELQRIVGTCVDIDCSLLGYYIFRVKEFVKDIVDKVGLLRYWYEFKEQREEKRNVI